ncbi:hypothetical protein EGR_11039 [Echinococcus granulosus]|uniref:Uncharacterized protein n=1 Tax=Echinococcus granulosus TaxID=6210 RepID=W6U0X0_ECHGR|nr:hypothetical protein EGR_11039 [Echinococcus granulosus]EUB54101.1 hypothetical protein EGR_11039 [Echinococcus granulosus]
MLPAATVTGISSNDAMSKWWGLILYRPHEFSKNSDDTPNKDGRQRRHQIGSNGYLLQAQPSNGTRNLAPECHSNDVDVLMTIAKDESLLALLQSPSVVDEVHGVLLPPPSLPPNLANAGVYAPALELRVPTYPESVPKL